MSEKKLSCIAVDLTPVLPGGENGGAKIFVLELLRRLAQMAPDSQFILLTQAAAHDELAMMDGPNLRRVMVVGSSVNNSPRSRVQGLASRILPHLPVRLRRLAGQLGSRMYTLAKRRRGSTLIRDLGADLLFCPFTAPTYYEPGVPTVCTIYDLQYKTYPEFFSAEDAAHRDATFKASCRKATVLTAISDYSRESAISHGNLDPARIRTIYLRMAQRIGHGGEHDSGVLDRLQVVPQRYIVYPANFWKHKNHEMLLTAFGMAAHNGLAADIKLVCTGAPGARQQWLKQAAHAMGLGGRVLFPGYLPNHELAALMANCAGVVFPSLYEGFGLPVIEAMSAGVPVACSIATSLPEVAADAAILFNPKVPTQIADAIRILVDDQPLRSRMIEAGRQRAAEFADADRMAQEYWALFQEALMAVQHGTILTGVYADGWVGPHLGVQIAPGNGSRTLEIELMAPDWLPHSSNCAVAVRSGKTKKTETIIKRGQTTLMSLPINPEGDGYKIQFTPTFVPMQIGLSNDQRELSVMMRRCTIEDALGEWHPLFPEDNPA